MPANRAGFTTHSALPERMPWRCSLPSPRTTPSAASRFFCTRSSCPRQIHTHVLLLPKARCGYPRPWRSRCATIIHIAMQQRSITNFKLEQMTSRMNAAIFGQTNQALLSRGIRINNRSFSLMSCDIYIHLLTKKVFVDNLSRGENIHSGQTKDASQIGKSPACPGTAVLFRALRCRLHAV